MLIEIQTFPLTTIRLKTLSAKGCPFRLGRNVLRDRVTLGACNDSSTDAQLYSRNICCHFTKPNQWPAVLVWDPKGHAAANLTVQHHYITSPSFGPWRDILNAIPTVTGISGLLYFTNLVKSPGVKDFDNIGQRNSLLPVGTGLYLNQSCIPSMFEALSTLVSSEKSLIPVFVRVEFSQLILNLPSHFTL